VIALLVPRRAGIADRDRLWAFCRRWWEGFGWPIVEGHHDGGPFNRSAAINRAAAEVPWEIGVIVDSDVICTLDAVQEAVDVAQTGRMAVAGNRRHDLSAHGTQKVLSGYRGAWDRWIRQTYTTHWSSCVAVNRGLWEEVGGFDERFVGWGYEDDAFKIACETFAGPMHRVDAPIWHLHHATQTTEHRRDNRLRADLYVEAAGDPAAIRALR